MLLAAIPANDAAWSLANAGKGGLLLWPMFGATNQLLGGLAFMVIAFYLWRRDKPVWFLIPPALFMLVMPLWALINSTFLASNRFLHWEAPGFEGTNWLLTSVSFATILLEIWMITEAVRLFPAAKGVLEAEAQVSSHKTGDKSPAAIG